MRIILFCSLCFLGHYSHAFSVSPMLHNLEPSGPSSTSSFVVRNRTNKTLKIATFMKERTHDKEGIEKEVPFNVNEHFVILPATAEVKPKQSLTVKVIYIGPRDLKVERAFRLTVADINPRPYREEKIGAATARVDATISYVSSIYVTPKNAEPKLLLEKRKHDGKPIFNLRNAGNKRTRFQQAKFIVSAGNLAVPEVYELSDFPSLISVLLAGDEREFVLPKSSKADPTTANVVFDQK